MWVPRDAGVGIGKGEQRTGDAGGAASWFVGIAWAGIPDRALVGKDG